MKKVILFVCLILLTGCSVEYNLEFDDLEFKENVVLNVEKTSDNSMLIENLKTIEPYAIIDKNSDSKYDKKINNFGNKFTASFSYKYLIDDYKRSKLFSSCYDTYGIFTDEDYIYISTEGAFNCMEYDYVPVDEVIIKFKTKYVVVDSNADEINDDTFIWTINSDNANDKPISIIMDRNKKVDNINTNNDHIFLGICVIIVVVIVLFLVFRIMSKRSDKL